MIQQKQGTHAWFATLAVLAANAIWGPESRRPAARTDGTGGSEVRYFACYYAEPFPKPGRETGENAGNPVKRPALNHGQDCSGSNLVKRITAVVAGMVGPRLMYQDLIRPITGWSAVAG